MMYTIVYIEMLYILYITGSSAVWVAQKIPDGHVRFLLPPTVITAASASSHLHPSLEPPHSYMQGTIQIEICENTINERVVKSAQGNIGSD